MIVALAIKPHITDALVPKLWRYFHNINCKRLKLMLTNEYTKVSAAKGIVFTCFLVFCTGTLLKPTYAQSMSDDVNDSQRQAGHHGLENQLHLFIQEKLLHHANNEDDIRIQVRELDSRINVPPCNSPFQFDTDVNIAKQSNVSVKVTCANNNWYLFMHANVAIVQQVVVSKENLSPGTLLSKRNVEVIEVDKHKLRGSTFNNIEEIMGARIKRRTRTGNIISDRMLCFICKGDRVTIAAVSAGLSIKVYGVAQEDGVLGDTIQVRNISSDKLVFAKIASTTIVEINI
jgi:flagella basal body P-ring formation protein FlgA